ncbi:Peptidoglycan L-alanyl-D-glutamate endopeptidase CwlK [Halioglobus japonicus]|nr:Peptidoglycan L-alanyl-D-glutamate endopeptidase CwlK [Halioglobus japonicus]
MAGNPFQGEIDAAQRASSGKLTEAMEVSGDARILLLDEHDRLNDKAKTLIRLGLEWAENRMRSIVSDIETMARDEAGRHSSIGGRLTDLANRVRGEIGLGPMGSGDALGVAHSQNGSRPSIQTVAQSALQTTPQLGQSPVPQFGSPSVDPSKRDADLGKLHPVMRQKVEDLLDDLKAAEVPMMVFEAYRPPERQAFLYAKGRTASGGKVTNANAWESFHQYGLAVDMVINEAGYNPWDESEQGKRWWAKYHELAIKNGLEPLSWEKPHIQMVGLSYQSLMAGEYPEGGDNSWSDNLVAAITRWPGSTKPKPPGDQERPPMRVSPAASVAARTLLPPPPKFDWMSLHGGQEWRVDSAGIYLRSINGGLNPVRSAGAPITATAILNLFGDALAEAAIRFQIAPEVLMMILATETGIYRKYGFTGPETFRWESHLKDYSAGPMQILASTAKDVNRTEGLGLDETNLPEFARKPNKVPDDLLLYEGVPAITIGAAFIRRNIERQGLTENPILVSAAYNAGSIRSSTHNLWRIHAHGNHLDRAVEWYGDACLVCGEHLRWR